MFNPDHKLFANQPTPKVPGISLSPDEWMKHRMNLFITFTLPSVMSQTNQNFTWIVLMDDMTPGVYRDILARITYRNLKFVYINPGQTGIIGALLNNIDHGQYDLITTRLDNDDAIHKTTINDIQTVYLQKNSEHSGPWVIGLPLGCTLDLASKKMYITEYPNNAYVSLVEDSQDAKSVWQCQHADIPSKFNWCFITPTLYWVTIIHSQNLANNANSNSGRTIYIDKEVNLRMLSDYGIDADNIDAMSKLTIEQIRNRNMRTSVTPIS
jgi:hypothetical protein